MQIFHNRWNFFRITQINKKKQYFLKKRIVSHLQLNSRRFIWLGGRQSGQWHEALMSSLFYFRCRLLDLGRCVIDLWLCNCIRGSWGAPLCHTLWISQDPWSQLLFIVMPFQRTHALAHADFSWFLTSPPPFFSIKIQFFHNKKNPHVINQKTWREISQLSREILNV